MEKPRLTPNRAIGFWLWIILFFVVIIGSWLVTFTIANRHRPEPIAPGETLPRLQPGSTASSVSPVSSEVKKEH
ncbi:MAG: hypothetical protein JW706_06800 [Opitutales bacterium]|nr:hypothetical protein [Opitutales bacterium]